MKVKMNWCKLDFQRAFGSKMFVATILLFPLFDILAIYIEAPGLSYNVISLITDIAIEGFSIAIYVFYTIPYSHSYCSDIENRFIKYYVVRSSLKKYVVSKGIFCALSSGCAVVLGRGITTLLLSAKYPLYEKHLLGNPDLITRILLEGRITGIFLTIFVLLFLQGSFYGVMAFTVSAYIPNFFLIAASPIILTRVIVDVTSLFPIGIGNLSLLRIYNLNFSNCQTLEGAAMYAFIFTVISIAVMIYISYGRIKRRFENE